MSKSLKPDFVQKYVNTGEFEFHFSWPPRVLGTEDKAKSGDAIEDMP